MADEKKKKKKKTNDEQKERKKNWREVYATVEDIKAFLSDRLFLRHNVITGRVECRMLDSMPPKFTTSSLRRHG